MKTGAGKMHLAVVVALSLSGPAQAQIDTTAEPGRPSYRPETAMCMRTDGANDKTCRPYPDAPAWPTTCGQAIQIFMSKLDDHSREYMRQEKYANLNEATMIWAMGLRNSFGLWRGNSALIASCQVMRPGASAYPVDISQIIIEEGWKKLR